MENSIYGIFHTQLAIAI